MNLARVIGTVVATRKDPELDGLKLLLLRPCDADGRATIDAPLVAADAVGAGVGEVVLYAAGSAARHTRVTKDRPIDAVVMAIVDAIDAGSAGSFDKQGDRNS